MSERSRGPKRRYDPVAVLDYIESYRRSHEGRSPSQRQIQGALGISAPSVVHNMLHRLEDQSLLTVTTYGRGLSADLTLTRMGHSMLEHWQQAKQAQLQT